MMEEVYNRAEYLEEGEKFRKCKESGNKIWKKNEYRSKITRKARFGRGKRF